MWLIKMLELKISTAWSTPIEGMLQPKTQVAFHHNHGDHVLAEVIFENQLQVTEDNMQHKDKQ